MQLRKILRIYNRFIVPAVTLLVCGIVGLYIILPAIRSILSINESQKVLTSEIASIKNRVMILESIDEQTLRSEMTSLMTSVPANKSPQTIFSTLDAVALSSGVTITDMTISSSGNIATQSALVPDSTSKGPNSVIAFEVSGNGSIDQMKKFLSTLSSVRRLFRVNTVSITFNQDGLLETSLKIDAFYAPLPKSLGNPTTVFTGFTANEEEIIGKLATYPLISEELSRYDSLPGVLYGNKADPFSAN